MEIFFILFGFSLGINIALLLPLFEERQIQKNIKHFRNLVKDFEESVREINNDKKEFDLLYEQYKEQEKSRENKKTP